MLERTAASPRDCFFRSFRRRQVDHERQRQQHSCVKPSDSNHPKRKGSYSTESPTTSTRTARDKKKEAKNLLKNQNHAPVDAETPARGLTERPLLSPRGTFPSASALELLAFRGGLPNPPVAPRSGVLPLVWCFCAPKRPAVELEKALAPPHPVPVPPITAEEGGEKDGDDPRRPCDVEKRCRGPPFLRKGWFRISSRDGRSSGFTWGKGREGGDVAGSQYLSAFICAWICVCVTGMEGESRSHFSLFGCIQIMF